MAFNGSGLFVRLYNWVNDAASGINIRADRSDAELDGIATGLTTCITKDGQTTTTAQIPFAQGISVTGGSSSIITLTLSGTTTLPGSGAISSSGQLGLGVVPAAIMHFKGASQSTAALTDAGIKTGVLWADSSDEGVGNGGGIILGTTGHQFAAIKALLQNGSGNYTGDLAFATRHATGDTALTEDFRTAAGLFLVGVTSGSFHTIKLAAATAAGTAILSVTHGGAGPGTAFYATSDVTGPNAANASMKIGMANGTGRSINSAGTNNAGGLDYAEYEYKANDCGNIAKGQIIGFDVNGRITDKWAAVASRFGVKTTNPSFVGGDTWGSEEALGIAEPAVLNKTDGEDDAAFAQRQSKHAVALSAFADKLEAARQTVDRIAYSGKVPCNITGAAVGDYIVAARSGVGIAGIPIAAPTFDQYRSAVGRVVSLLPDGRCTIAVMVH